MTDLLRCGECGARWVGCRSETRCPECGSCSVTYRRDVRQPPKAEEGDDDD